MIVRKLDDDKVVVIALDYTASQEQAFIVSNPNGGFMQIDNLPDQPDFGQNYKWSGSEVIVDEAANMVATQLITKKNSLAYLASTDWYVTRQSETDVAVPQAILTLRAEARAAVVTGA
jgi:hypothetical protein